MFRIVCVREKNAPRVWFLQCRVCFYHLGCSIIFFSPTVRDCMLKWYTPVATYKKPFSGVFMTTLASIAQDLPCPSLKYSPNCKLEDMGH